ncbi:MAG: tRNA pseudouridine(13) synthase TruD [Pseudomonadota bacterium]
MPAKLPDWACAHGGPVAAAALRTAPEDFIVDELLDVEFTGDGEHDWLKIEKRGSNTDWIARQLARHADTRPSDVGYAGLKDRHAVTTQWFSIWRRAGADVDWTSFAADGARVLAVERHQRKLRRGTHSGNRFRITARGATVGACRDAIEARVAALTERGAPNYFGEQRFGRDAANLELARKVLGGARVKRQQRSIALSAGRAYLFNGILHTRVLDGSWDTLLEGERANLDGSGSLFGVDVVDEELRSRLKAGDIHPTATLWGQGAPIGDGAVQALESAVARSFDTRTAELAAGLESARIDAGSRPTRLVAHELAVEVENDSVRFDFRLSRGSYATALLREVFTTP